MTSMRWRPCWAACLGSCFVAATLGVPRPCRAAGRATYASDLAAFFDEVDKSYPFFELKGIGDDWAATKKRLAAKVRTCRSDEAFLGLVVEAIRCLRDSHMWVRSEKAKAPPPPKQYYSGISFLPATENRVVVLHPP